MAKPPIDDALREIIEPLLPPPKPRRFGDLGRRPTANRKALMGIVCVLETGIPPGGGAGGVGACGMTCICGSLGLPDPRASFATPDPAAALPERCPASLVLP